MTRDLTEGSCLKQILLFTAALLVGNLLQQTYNLVDAAIVGRWATVKRPLFFLRYLP